MQRWQVILAIGLTGLGLSGPQTLSAQGLPGGFVYLRDIEPDHHPGHALRRLEQFRRQAAAGLSRRRMRREARGRHGAEADQQELARQKLSLKMFDCYRPERAVADMVAWSKNGKETSAERRFNPAFRKADLFRLGYIATRPDIRPVRPSI